jgi:hypothetical protein
MRQILDEQLVEMLGWLGLAALLENQKIFTALDMSVVLQGELSLNEHQGERENGEGEQQILIAKEESHVIRLRQKYGRVQLHSRAGPDHRRISRGCCPDQGRARPTFLAFGQHARRGQRALRVVIGHLGREEI